MRKFLFASLSVFLLIIGLTFLSPVRQGVFEFVLASKTKAVLGQPIRYERVTRQGDLYVLEGVEILRTEEGDGAGYLVTAPRMEVAFQADWWKRAVASEVTLIDPEIAVDKGTGVDLPTLSLDGWLEESLLDVELKVALQNGTLLLQQEEKSEEIVLEGDLSITNKIHGSLVARFSGGRADGNTLLLDFDGRFGEMTLDIACQEVDAEPLMGALRYLLGTKVGRIHVDSGVVAGRAVAYLQEGQFPLVDGELIGRQLRFAHRDFSLQGLLEEVRLQLNGLTNQRETDNPSLLIAQAEISDGSELFLFKGGEKLWQVKDFEGSLRLGADQNLAVRMEGIALSDAPPARLTLNGDARGVGNTNPALHLAITLDSNTRPEVGIDLKWQWEPEGKQLLSARCEKIGPAEFAAAQVLLGPFHPGSYDLDFHKGTLTFSVIAYGAPGRPEELLIEDLLAQKFAFTYHPWQWSASGHRLSGNGRFDLLNGLALAARELNAELYDGAWYLEGVHHAFAEAREVQADIELRNGVIEHSQIEGRVGGLAVALDVDETASVVAKLGVEGTSEQVSRLFPEKRQADFLRGLPHAEIKADCQLTRMESGVEAKGTLFVDGGNRPVEKVRFGWEMVRHDPSAEETYTGLSERALYRRDLLAPYYLSPTIANPSKEFLAEWAEDQLSWRGIRIQNGWAEGYGLPIEHFLSPFLFPERSRILMTGKADAKLSFDNSHLVVEYHGEEVQIDSPEFHLSIPKIGEEGEFAGVHYYDYHQDHDFGFLPIEKSSYRDRKFDLFFEDLSAHLTLGEKRLYFNDLEASCEGIRMAGVLDLDYSSPAHGVVDVDIQTRRIEGSFSQLQSLLTHFDSDFLQNVPIEGKVISPENGARLKLAIRPFRSTATGHVHGSLVDGGVAAENGRVLLEGLFLNFGYNSDDNLLTLDDLAGKVWVGPETNRKVYTLSSRNTEIGNFPNPTLQFDVRVEDITRDFIRLVGTGTATPQERQEGIFELHLDPDRTTIGRLQPNITQLAVRNWREIVALRAEPVVDLVSLLDDLQRFSQTGWFLASSGELDPLKDYDVEGQVRGVVSFDPLTTTYNFSAVGQEISVAGTPITAAFLSGKKTEKKWTIEQFQLDDLSVAADLFPSTDGWELGFVGVRYGNALLIGLEGHYWPGTRHLLADIKMMELQLDKAQEFEALVEFVEEWNPKGMVKGTGALKLTVGSEGDRPRYEMDLDATLEHLEVGGVKLNSRETVEAKLDSEKGLEIRGINGQVTEIHGIETDLNVSIAEVTHELVTKETEVKELRFSIPPEQLEWLGEVAQATAPDKMSGAMVDAFSTLKKGEPLEGSLTASWSPSYHTARLELDEGAYYFGESAQQLKDFSLDYDPYELRIATQVLFRDHYYWLSGRSLASELDYGQVLLADKPPSKLNEKEQPLMIFWEWDENHGLQVRRAEGLFSGIEVHIGKQESSQPKESLRLLGQVHVDWQKAAPLLNPELKSFIEKWKVGDGYELSGTFTLDKNRPGELWFEGALLGRDFSLMGHRLRTLHSQVLLTPEQINVEEVMVVDKAGSVRVPKVTMEKVTDEKWTIDVPRMVAEEVKPSRLEKADGIVKEERAFTIKQVELSNVSGTLGEPNSFVGHGQLSFINPSKRNLRNTLLAIPSELLMRIGLTADALTPVVGRIHYDVHDARIFLSEFEDMYSEGHVSKFYLPSGPFQSNVDFDGNLNVRVKMKQYNIIFKLAELFTISIGGTLDNPTFSLQRQKDSGLEAFDGDVLSPAKG